MRLCVCALSHTEYVGGSRTLSGRWCVCVCVCVCGTRSVCGLSGQFVSVSEVVFGGVCVSVCGGVVCVLVYVCVCERESV